MTDLWWVAPLAVAMFYLGWWVGYREASTRWNKAWRESNRKIREWRRRR